MFLLEELRRGSFLPWAQRFLQMQPVRLRTALGRLSLPQTRLDREIAGGNGSVEEEVFVMLGAE